MANELITRSMEEITASVRIHMQNMVNNALDLGIDLMEAKEACGHGRWLPWLKSVGISSSTAANYMKIAREVSSDSKMAKLPYSKVLALLSLPAEEREEAAEAAESMSAAEIRRLTEERNKAAEAANVETARADAAEADAKRFYDENAGLRSRVKALESDISGMQDMLEREHAALLTAENNRVEVEVPPADYEQLKKNQADLMNAAADAEERAAALEEELETLRNRSEEQISAAKTLRIAVTAFMSDCQMLPAHPEQLKRDQNKIERSVDLVESWCAAMREALAKVIDGEAVIA